MLESNFSKQAIQPYLDNEFPLFKEATEDRLFKHVTFPTDDTDGIYRLTVVDHNYIKQINSQSVVQKKVQTNLSYDKSEEALFRIKAVLSQPEHGVTESNWVTHKFQEGDIATAHNQYRMRGVSLDRLKGDWVYSNIKDFDNDLIVYNMIYDVLDLLLTAHDDQIDYLMDYIVSDTFAEVLKELDPQFKTLLDLEETKGTSIEELLNLIGKSTGIHSREAVASKLGEQFALLADELKKNFKENIMSSPEEFSQLYRLYKLVDQYDEKKTDFIQLLAEIFLEDRYEKLVQNTDIEVIMQNEQEMGIYLNGTYEFDIKNELINSICNASFDDSFVTTLNDAVELISEPIIYEQLKYSNDETVEKMLRMILKDIIAPIAAIDKHLLEISTDLEDDHEQQMTAGIIEFTIIDEDEEELRNLLVMDVIEAVIKGDMDPLIEDHVELVDIMLKKILDKRHLLVEYFSDEVLKLCVDIGERFRSSYTKEFGSVHEYIRLSANDQFNLKDLKGYSSLTDSYMAALQEAQHMMPTLEGTSFKEYKSASMNEDVEKQYLLFKEAVQELFKSVISDLSQTKMLQNEKAIKEAFYSIVDDRTLLEQLIALVSQDEKVRAFMIDKAISAATIKKLFVKESKVSYQEDGYYNLFKHYLRNPNKFPILSKLYLEIFHNPIDWYLLDLKEVIQYALGDMDEGWPIGEFRLGINTLKGEVS